MDKRLILLVVVAVGAVVYLRADDGDRIAARTEESDVTPVRQVGISNSAGRTLKNKEQNYLLQML